MAIGKLCPGDQPGAKQQPGGDLHRMGKNTLKHPGIDGIFDDQHTGNGQRDPARPDGQLFAEKLLEAKNQLAGRG